MERVSKLIATLVALVALGLPVHARAQSAAAGPDASPTIRLSADGDWLQWGVPAAVEASLSPTILLGTAEGEAWRPGLAAVLVAPIGDQRVTALATREVIVAPTALGLAQNVAPWCAGVGGYLVASSECLMQASDVAAQLEPQLRRDRATLGFDGENFYLSLGGGAAQLQSPVVRSEGMPAAALVGAGSNDTATRWVLVGADSARDLSLGAGWNMPWLGVVDIEATLAEIALGDTANNAVDLRLRESSLRLGLSRGSFSGGFTGRVVRPENAGRLGWSSLDLGVVWRTPWQGELSFGAENLLTTREDGEDPKPNPRLDNASARTPYVRYTQDF
jgi:hypothetical protein